MTQTSQQLRMAKEDLAPHFRPQGPRVLKIGAALVFACGLALAPVPTFAQHGGGGGGGAHGGGGGGSHGGSGGGFGGGGSAAGSNGGGSHASGGSAGHSGASTSNSSGNSGGGHSWNPFHSSAAKPAPANGSSGVRREISNLNRTRRRYILPQGITPGRNRLMRECLRWDA
jgi:hypothetical protein